MSSRRHRIVHRTTMRYDERGHRSAQRAADDPRERAGAGDPRGPRPRAPAHPEQCLRGPLGHPGHGDGVTDSSRRPRDRGHEHGGALGAARRGRGRRLGGRARAPHGR
uniref:Uncharacterized protein n=1 Tax=Janibacter limosus TaxID=53458 RepID=A0AC61U1B9_9MICO|nr:hypothetical protein [Janibacter limosus]